MKPILDFKKNERMHSKSCRRRDVEIDGKGRDEWLVWPNEKRICHCCSGKGRHNNVDWGIRTTEEDEESCSEEDVDDAPCCHHSGRDQHSKRRDWLCSPYLW